MDSPQPQPLNFEDESSDNQTFLVEGHLASIISDILVPSPGPMLLPPVYNERGDVIPYPVSRKTPTSTPRSK